MIKPERTKDIFSVFCQYLILAILVSIPVCAPVVMVKYMVDYPELFSASDLPVLALWLVTVAVAYILLSSCRWSRGTWMAFCYGFANVAMIASLMLIDTIPCSDYKIIYDTAVEVYNGTFDVYALAFSDYLNMYPYQMGMVALEVLSMKLFGLSLLPLQIMTLLLINLTIYLVYRIGRRLFSERVALMSMLLLATYYPVLITVNQPTNQHIAAPLILMALMCMQRDRWPWWLAAGAIAVIMNVFRPMGIMLMLTAIVYGIYLTASRRKLLPMVNLIVFILVYKLGVFATDAVFVKAELTNGPISTSGMTYFKFDKGLTGYEPDFTRFDNMDDYNQWERDKLIGDIKSKPAQIAAFVTNKMVRYQGGFDWKFENTYNHDSALYDHYPEKAGILLGWAQYLVIALLALFGFNRLRRVRPLDTYQIFYIGITMVYVFIEAFSSYRYESYPILMLMAGYGLAAIKVKKSR